MGGDGGYAKGFGSIPSPVVKVDHGDDGDTWGGRGVVIPPGGGGNVRCGTSYY